MALLQQTAAYVTTFVAQYYGAKRLDRIGPSVWQSIYVSIAGGLLFLLLIPAAGTLFHLVGHSQAMQKLGPSISWRSVTPACPPRWWRRPAGFSRVLATRRSSCASTWWGHRQRGFRLCVDLRQVRFPRPWASQARVTPPRSALASAFYGLYRVSEKHESEYRVRSGWRYDADLMKRTLKFRRAERLAVGARGTRVQHFPRVHRAHEQRRCGARCQRDRGDGDDAGGASRLGCGPAVSVLVGQHRGENGPRNRKSRRGADCRWL